jgi:integrase
MASIVNRPDGHRWVQFVDIDGKRKTIRLGRADKKTAATTCGRVESLLVAKINGTAIDRDTAGWLRDLDGPLYAKLAAVGLCLPRESAALGQFLDGYIDGRADVKGSTATVYGHTRRCLVEFYGGGKPLREITPGDAEAWRVWLGTKANARDKHRDELSANTVNRRCGIAKQFFRAALKRGLIGANPFADLSGQVRGNRARQYFVSRAEIDAALKAAPDYEWRLIIALARYGGLRVPSELLALRWADVDLPGHRMVIHASKTEHHESAGERACPIFPELAPYLETAWDAALPGAEYVIERYRDSNANLRTGFTRIVRSAGLKPWPKLFHNLRASRQTELLDHFPIKAVCDWLGNSSPVALEHYAQVTAAHFQAATVTQTAPKLVVEAKQNPKQLAAVSTRDDSHGDWSAHEKTPTMPGSAALCETLQKASVGGTRLELVTSTMSKQIADSGKRPKALLFRHLTMLAEIFKASQRRANSLGNSR